MDVLTALLIELIVIAVLFEIARRLGLPYPALFVLGGLALGFVPWIPHITLEPDLVLLVFLPPLLFGAAFETPQRDLRRNIWPITRLSIGLVILTTVIVAAVAQALVPGLGWAAAFALGAIVAPTDALAATTVFRRLGVPRLDPHPRRGRGAVQRRVRADPLPRRRARGGDRGLRPDRRRRHLRHRLGRRDRDRLRRRAGDGRDRQMARRPAGRGHRLAPDPVRGLPPGRGARTCPASSPSSRRGW